MLAALLASSTWNEYVIKRNLIAMAAVFFAVRLITSSNIPILTALLSSRLATVLEVIMMLVFLFNVFSHVTSTQSSQSILQKFPLYNYLFNTGPVTRGVYMLIDHVYCFAKNQYIQATTKKKASSTPQPQPPTNNNQPASAPPAVPSTNPQARSQPWKGPINDSPAIPEITKATSPYDPKTFAWMPAERSGDPSFNISLPKLEYTPSHVTRKKKTTRTNKYLWRLCPQPNIIERFRSEQYDDFQENWHRFEDRSSKVYYDRLRQWISSNIFTPAVRTVEAVEKQLPKQGTSFVDCPLNILALLITDPSYVDDNALSVALVQKLLNLPGYENNRARKYVIERMQELGKQSRFRLITKESDLPSDSEIVFHVFKTYLTHTMPNVVPPLLPVQGEILKFLLIYFYITEDISKEIFY
ncbi:predicted protein [Lichtheimia corymbifera JMRC:FSU:9682]|uniref:Uncharacterized protein n=1 Tax=Lichtheimia corymbifera JMRC:FSU:9682 TaxID=1263082 RepID=A0A068S1I0_9FUNG|nr:predicted protein [Lichtheimia corymbifera JMRC:FSU:9682]